MSLVVAMLVAAPATAQLTATGNLFGRITDDGGQPLPGVTVTLSGLGAPKTTVTNAGGEYRFLNLSPGSYAISHQLSGFSPVNRGNVLINIGKNTTLDIKLKLATVQEAIVVTGESPLLDTRKLTTGATATKVELTSIPTARDPWVIMQTVPGVLVDRVNVGGNESGQQSAMVSKGASGDQTTWNVDGVAITDMGALASPTYYDFDSFEEIQVSTGGSDPSVQTAGVQLNMVTKRGSNDVHGAARVFITDKNWQATNTPDEAKEQLEALGQTQATNKITGIQDYGADVGGPIVRDRLWLWGSYGRNQIDLVTTGGATDKTTLEGVNAKLNAQIVDSNSATLFYSRNQKIKLGRNSSPSRPTPDVAWNQDGPTDLYKLEDSHVFSPSFFLTAIGSYIDERFRLISPGTAPAYIDADGVWHNSFYDYTSVRLQGLATATASAFFRTGDMGHEAKFGFGYKQTPASSTSAWDQDYYADEYYFDIPVAAATRPVVFKVDQFYTSFYISDTMTLKNLTINAGIRYDRQRGTNTALQIPASKIPSNIFGTIGADYLGGIDAPETDPGFTWTDWQPRLGLTYALGSDQKTLARASYARFADQLGAGNIGFNQISPGVAYAYFPWHDDGDHVIEPGEVDTSEFYDYRNFDPADPYALSSPNQIDPEFSAITTDELILGVEREILPAFAVSANFTYRHLDNFYRLRGIGVDQDDYEVKGTVSGTLPDGTPYSVPYYGLKAGVERPAGRILENRPDYSQTYAGLELQLNKRYSNRWMMRASFAYNDWTQDVGRTANSDPTCRLPGGETSRYLGCEDGGVVVQGSGTGSGSKGGVYINSKYQGNVSGMYSLPLGFNVAGNFFFRQGYPIPYFRQQTVGGQPSGESPKRISVTSIGDRRLNTVTSLDLRAEKVLKVSSLDFTLSIDVFNVFNSNAVLQREHRLEVSTTNFIRETQSPRVVRFGGRFSF